MKKMSKLFVLCMFAFGCVTSKDLLIKKRLEQQVKQIIEYTEWEKKTVPDSSEQCRALYFQARNKWKPIIVDQAELIFELVGKQPHKKNT